MLEVARSRRRSQVLLRVALLMEAPFFVAVSYGLHLSKPCVGFRVAPKKQTRIASRAEAGRIPGGGEHRPLQHSPDDPTVNALSQSRAGARSPWTVTSFQDSHERQVFVERRPVRPTSSSVADSSRGLPLVGKLTSWPLANLTKIIPRSCRALRVRSAKVLGPFLFDEFEIVIDEVLCSRQLSDIEAN